MNRQLKRFLSAGLAAIMLSTAALPASAASVTDFKDVSPSAWYYSAVEYAASNGLFSGTGKDTFSPDTAMTRGMFVTVLGRKSGVSDTDPASTSFSDVKTTDYFAPYVEWAAGNGIVSGMGGGRYAPNKEISRQEMATILYRYSQKTGNEGIQNGTEILKYPDTGTVADWAKEAMTWAVDKKIINGSGGKLNPAGTATRAQVAQVFLNAKDVLVKTEITPGEEPGEFTPVPIGQLANYDSLHKGLSDEQFAQVYQIALEIATPCANLSKEQQLAYVAHAVSKIYFEGTYSMTTPHYGDAYGVFVSKSASCAGCTRATGLCLNILGIPYEHVNEGLYKHQWCRVKLGSTYWICDGYDLVCKEVKPYTHPALDDCYQNAEVPELPAFQCALIVTANGKSKRFVCQTESGEDFKKCYDPVGTIGNGQKVTLDFEILSGRGPYEITWYDDSGNSKTVTTGDTLGSYEFTTQSEIDPNSKVTYPGVAITDTFGNTIRFFL